MTPDQDPNSECQGAENMGAGCWHAAQDLFLLGPRGVKGGATLGRDQGRDGSSGSDSGSGRCMAKLEAAFGDVDVNAGEDRGEGEGSKAAEELGQHWWHADSSRFMLGPS